jgi:hypothetical protein
MISLLSFYIVEINYFIFVRATNVDISVEYAYRRGCSIHGTFYAVSPISFDKARALNHITRIL